MTRGSDPGLASVAGCRQRQSGEVGLNAEMIEPVVERASGPVDGECGVAGKPVGTPAALGGEEGLGEAGAAVGRSYDPGAGLIENSLSLEAVDVSLEVEKRYDELAARQLGEARRVECQVARSNLSDRVEGPSPIVGTENSDCVSSPSRVVRSHAPRLRARAPRRRLVA